MIISESFKRFQYFDFEKIFWESKTFFKIQEYRFLVETTKIENTSFQFKTALSEAHVKTIEWRLQNGPITNSGVLPITT